MNTALIVIVPVALLVVLAVLFLQNDDSPDLRCSLAGGNVFYKMTAAIAGVILSLGILSALV